MKSSIEVAVLALVAVAGSIGAWVVQGRPSGKPEVELSKQPLRDGEVSLETLKADDFDGILWVDARKKADWQKDGVSGSINITHLSDEDLGMQVANHAGALLDAKKVIVYCDGYDCTLSHDLVKALTADYRDFIEGEILVLHGGMVALRKAGMVKSSSPDS